MKAIFTCIMLVLTTSVWAQQPEFNWAIQFGGTSDEGIEDMAVDEEGNVYSVGWFYGTVDMVPGPGTGGWTSLGGVDIFISKLDSSGQNVWAKRIGNGNHNYAYDLTLDSEDNVIITGHYSGTMDFDPSNQDSYDLTAGYVDTYVLKLDSDGNFIWVKDFRSDFLADAYGKGVTVDNSDNIYVTGTFEDSVDFDPGLGEFKLHDDDGNLFVTKLNADGEFIWAKQLVEGTGYVIEGENISIGTDNTNSVYVSGTFTGTADFDPSVGQYEMISPGSNSPREIFVVKLSSSGDFIWAGQIGGAYYDFVHDMVVGGDGSCYITGTYGYDADFDPDEFGQELEHSNHGTAAFICKWDTDRNHEWSHTVVNSALGGPYYGYGVALDDDGNVYNTGRFVHEADFDPDPDSTVILDPTFVDAYVTRYDASGDLVWANIIETDTDDCYGYEIGVDPIGNVYIGGTFNETTDFNPDTLDVDNLVSFGYEDVYITKWNHAESVVTSSEPLSAETDISFYPNPTRDNLWVEVYNTFEKNQLQVLDMQGRVVLQDQLLQGRKNVSLPELAEGTYVLRFVNEKDVLSHRLIIN